MKRRVKYVIGVDEVGRGPLAGPVAVGAILIPVSRVREFVGVKESKQLSEKKRELWFGEIKEKCKDRETRYAVSLVSPQVIDRKGIAYAIRLALARSLEKLDADPKETLVLLDGGLFAPEKYTDQRTIVGGDRREIPIALASIAAKVTRDRRMRRLDNKYPGYGFAAHKGYGTALHIRAIRQSGPIPEHRVSFLGNILT